MADVIFVWNTLHAYKFEGGLSSKTLRWKLAGDSGWISVYSYFICEMLLPIAIVNVEQQCEVLIAYTEYMVWFIVGGKDIWTMW